jgi:hypothetical protein
LKFLKMQDILDEKSKMLRNPPADMTIHYLLAL